jgi:XTP/dITP diphosphohydrolase
VLTLDDLGIRVDCPERGASFGDNARAKSLCYSRMSPHLTLAEDSGLEVAGLGGEPGVRSARYAGPRATDEENIGKTLSRLRRLPRPGRRARFVSVMALSRQGRILKVVRGQVRGTITPGKRGEQGFGYDPIFYYHPFRKTFGEIPLAKKNRVSHRSRALARMIHFLRDNYDEAGGGTVGRLPRRKGSARLKR